MLAGCTISNFHHIRGGIKRGSEYGIVSKCREHDKTRAHNGSELRFATVLAIICRPTLRRFAPSLRAQFSFFTLPGVPRLRRSTAGLFYGAPPGLRIPLASARKHPFKFRFIELFAIHHELKKHALRVLGVRIGLTTGGGGV